MTPVYRPPTRHLASSEFMLFDLLLSSIFNKEIIYCNILLNYPADYQVILLLIFTYFYSGNISFSTGAVYPGGILTFFYIPTVYFFLHCLFPGGRWEGSTVGPLVLRLAVKTQRQMEHGACFIEPSCHSNYRQPWSCDWQTPLASFPHLPQSWRCRGVTKME